LVSAVGVDAQVTHAARNAYAFVGQPGAGFAGTFRSLRKKNGVVNHGQIVASNSLIDARLMK
jgi:hypothetical protein